MVAVAVAVLLGAVALGVPEPVRAQGALHEVGATVADETGRPVRSLWVGAFVHHDSTGVYQSRLTDAGGLVRFQLVAGNYHLHVLTERFSECIVGVGGLQHPEGQVGAVFAAVPGGSSDIHITLARRTPATGSTWIPCRLDIPFHSIEGRVLGPGGAPVGGLRVRAFGELGETFGPWEGSPTSESGTFAVEVPAGAYLIEFDVITEGSECQLGYAGSDGVHAYGHLERVIVDEAGVDGLTVRLPGNVEELCRPIGGLLTDGVGAPLGSTSIAADGLSPLAGFLRANGASRPDGTFTLYAPEGRYRIYVATTAGRTCEVANHDREGPGQWGLFGVGAGGVDRIHVTVSGEPSASLQTMICSFPPEMITTRLRPGWNLVGWTGAEAPASALFEAVPALTAAHAWDSETQSFQTAFREGPALQGALETLAPGMGLWLAVGGNEDVAWTRPLQTDSALVFLREGWNLVAWVGGEGRAAPFAELGAALHEAAVLDAMTGALVSHRPGDAAISGTLPLLERGDAFWLNLAEEQRWLQPGSVTPSIDFVGEIAGDVRSSLPVGIESVLAYFAERYALLLPEVTWRVGQTPGLIGQAPDHCGVYASWAVYLSEPCAGAAAHEYAHAIQAYVAGTGYETAAWIVEGVANRWSAEYYDATGEHSYERHLAESVLPAARRTPIALEEMEGTLFIDNLAAFNYSVAHLAIDWLVTLTGEDRTFDYFAQLAWQESWRDAFEDVFGIGVEDFYASFAAHRAEVAAPLAVIAGVALDAEGNPLPGVWLQAIAPDGTGQAWTESGEDGAFSLLVHDGEYLLEVYHTVEGDPRRAGWYAGHGRFTLRRDEAKPLDVADDGIGGLEVLVPEFATRRFGGVVRDATGRPLGGVSVSGRRIGDWPADWEVTTDAAGQFDVTALAFGYQVEFQHGQCFSGWYGEKGDLLGDREEAVEFPAASGDAMGLDVNAPHPCSRVEGVVVGPRGEPEGGVVVLASPTVGEQVWIALANEVGRFNAVVPQGSYVVSIKADDCILDLAAGAHEQRQVSAAEIRLSLTRSHVTGLTLKVRSSPSDICRRIAGVVVGPDDAPVAGEFVLALPIQEPLWGVPSTSSLEDGSFTLSVRDGSYRLNLSSQSFNTCEADGHVQTATSGRALLVVDGEDITGLKITVSGDPPEDEGPGWYPCWLSE